MLDCCNAAGIASDKPSSDGCRNDAQDTQSKHYNMASRIIESSRIHINIKKDSVRDAQNIAAHFLYIQYFIIETIAF
jgi:hypothetical protein